MTAKELLRKVRREVARDAALQEKITRKYGGANQGVSRQLVEAYLRDVVEAPILRGMDDREQAIARGVLVAAVPMDTINARAMRTDAGEFLVVLNERLMALIHTWNELQILSAVKGGEDGSLAQFARTFAPIMDCYLTPLSGKTLPVFDFDELEPPYQMLAAVKTTLAEQFILAHELAHICLGHIGPAPEKSFARAAYWETYDAQNDMQQMEFDADAQAVQWLLAGGEAAGGRLLLAVEVLALLHFIECNTGFPPKQASHPSAIARLRNLRERFGSDVFGAEGYSIDAMLKNMEDVEGFRITAEG